MHVFGPIDSAGAGGYKDALNAAFDDFTHWRREHKITCSHKRFSFNGLFNEEYGAFLNAKGYNARVLSEWLLDCVRQTNFGQQAAPPRTLGVHPGPILPDERMELCEVALCRG